MKDLLADLQVEDGDFSLDQLEQELAQLDHEPPQLHPLSLPTLNAASLVVSHAQERSAIMGTTLPAAASANHGMDAWSQSLAQFTALSLQDDFLAADSAKKQREQHHTAAPPGISLEGAEDYDIGEKQAVVPPPGLRGPPGLPTGSTRQPPNPKAFPRTPQNSLNIAAEEDVSQLLPQTALGTDAIPPQGSSATTSGFPPVTAIPRQSAAPTEGIARPSGAIPPQNRAPQGGMPIPSGVIPPQMQGVPFQPGYIPPQGGMPVQPGRTPQGGPPMGMMMPPPGGMPVPVAVPTGGPAWQTPRAPPPPVIRAFCNPHPAAPPIPATALETQHMSARDIAYVIHSIMKPVLMEGVSENDYYVQFLRRVGGPHANPANPKNPKDMNEEMASRSNKSKEWSSEKHVLGHVAKTNVTRPRALIATPQAASEQDSEQKQRASLWKARVYCDQAYQSYQMVVDIWRSAPPGGVPPQVQLQLAKLMKCMGITLVDKVYQVDAESLKLLIKLNKGRTLIARVFEQALLPPNAVLALLPELLDALLASLRKADENKGDVLTNERLFRSITGVIQKLNTSSKTLLQCLQVVQGSGKVALSSTARMECVHTLLQKGSMVAGRDPSEETRTAWGEAESQFMSLLQAF